MSTNAQSAQGMTLQMSPSGSAEVYVTIPELRNINGPTGQANEIDVTDLSSTGKEYVLGLQDFGDITADGFYLSDNAIHRAVKAAFSDGVVRKFRLPFTDTAPATIWEFSGYIKTFSITAGVDQVVGMNLAVRTTGDITEYN